MKREYTAPQMEAIEIAVQQMLAVSGPTSTSGDGGFDSDITGGSGGGRAPGLFDDPAWDELLGE